jgi:hypothetical protein
MDEYNGAKGDKRLIDPWWWLKRKMTRKPLGRLQCLICDFRKEGNLFGKAGRIPQTGGVHVDADGDTRAERALPLRGDGDGAAGISCCFFHGEMIILPRAPITVVARGLTDYKENQQDQLDGNMYRWFQFHGEKYTRYANEIQL